MHSSEQNIQGLFPHDCLKLQSHTKGRPELWATTLCRRTLRDTMVMIRRSVAADRDKTKLILGQDIVDRAFTASGEVR